MTSWLNQASAARLKYLQTGLLAAVLCISTGAFALGDALNGQKIYPTCVGCHNVVQNNNDQKINNAGGTKANQGVPSAITTGIKNNPGDMGKYAAGGSNALSATQLADMAAYINAVIFDNCLATPGTSGITGKTGAACSTSSTGVTILAPTACAAQALSWTVNNNTCDGSAPATKIGLSATLSDTTGPATGSANYTCGANGVWSTPSSASCALPPPADCAAKSVQWNVGTDMCDGTAQLTTSGSAIVVQDNAGTTTGSASYSCTNGQWSAASAQTCSTTVVPPPTPCAAKAFTWTVGGASCDGTTALTTSGSSSVLKDTLAPNTGSATYACSNGTWAGPTSATCAAIQADCPATNLAWTVGTNACNASALAATSGANASLQDVAGPTTGVAKFLCTNGSWGPASAATCVTAAPLDCAATALNWTVGTNACSASAVATVSGSVLTVTDTVAPTTGTAAFSCTNGVFAVSAGATCAIVVTGPRGVSSVNGEILWKAALGTNGNSCALCHGATKPERGLLKVENAAGTAANQGDPASIRRGIQNSSRMFEFAAVTDADLADLAAYVNATLYAKILTVSDGTAVVKPYVIWQNGVTVTSVVMPSVALGSASSIKTILAVQAPATAGLHIDHLAINGAMFTLNSVATNLAGLAIKPCPAGAFDLVAGEACGIEVVLAVSKPGVATANLEIYTDPVQKPETVAVEASITAQATGGQGGGGCTLRSSPGLVDPLLLLLTALALAALVLRRRQNASH
jgi:hypothetical protein